MPLHIPYAPSTALIVSVDGTRAVWTPPTGKGRSGTLLATPNVRSAYEHAVDGAFWTPVFGVLIQAGDRTELAALAALSHLAPDRVSIISCSPSLSKWIAARRREFDQPPQAETR